MGSAPAMWANRAIFCSTEHTASSTKPALPLMVDRYTALARTPAEAEFNRY